MEILINKICTRPVNAPNAFVPPAARPPPRSPPRRYDASEATRSTQEEFIYLDDDDSETSNDVGDPSFNPLEPTP